MKKLQLTFQEVALDLALDPHQLGRGCRGLHIVLPTEVPLPLGSRGRASQCRGATAVGDSITWGHPFERQGPAEVTARAGCKERSARRTIICGLQLRRRYRVDYALLRFS